MIAAYFKTNSLSQPFHNDLKGILEDTGAASHPNKCRFKSTWLWNVYLIEIDLLWTYSTDQGHMLFQAL